MTSIFVQLTNFLVQGTASGLGLMLLARVLHESVSTGIPPLGFWSSTLIALCVLLIVSSMAMVAAQSARDTTT